MRKNTTRIISGCVGRLGMEDCTSFSKIISSRRQCRTYFLLHSLMERNFPGPEFYNERGGGEGGVKLRFLDKKLVNMADNKG